jgi:hypothetical protein
MTSPGGPVDWPLPDALFEWLGEAHISRDSQTNAILGVTSAAFQECYTRWYNFHCETTAKLNVVAGDLRALKDEKKGIAKLRERVALLEKETTKLHEDSTKYHDKAEAWSGRYEKLADSYEALRTTPAGNTTPGTQGTVHKMKPLQPTRYEGSQDLEVVTKFLDEVEHYVRQGASACPKASSDNQNIDTFWRFLSVKTFRWFEKEMKDREVETIPPPGHDYGFKWSDLKTAFKEQFVPEVAVSVVRKEWHELRFNEKKVLKFNERALELVEILGGSLSITRGNPLWEEYLHKLPRAASQDITQQARLMRRVHKIELTLSDMMEIIAERTLPYLPPVVSSGTPGVPSTTPTTSNTDYGDPMDLSNVDDADLYTMDDTSAKRCFHCTGFGHVARQCPTPNASARPAQFRQNQQRNEQQRGGAHSQRNGRHGHNGGHQQSRRESPTQHHPMTP